MLRLETITTVVVLTAITIGQITVKTFPETFPYPQNFTNCYENKLNATVLQMCGLDFNLSLLPFLADLAIYKECCEKNCTTKFIEASFCPKTRNETETSFIPKNYDSEWEETGGPSPSDCPKAWQQITEMISEDTYIITTHCFITRNQSYKVMLTEYRPKDTELSQLFNTSGVKWKTV